MGGLLTTSIWLQHKLEHCKTVSFNIHLKHRVGKSQTGQVATLFYQKWYLWTTTGLGSEQIMEVCVDYLSVIRLSVVNQGAGQAMYYCGRLRSDRGEQNCHLSFILQIVGLWPVCLFRLLQPKLHRISKCSNCHWKDYVAFWKFINIFFYIWF